MLEDGIKSNTEEECNQMQLYAYIYTHRLSYEVTQ